LDALALLIERFEIARQFFDNGQVRYFTSYCSGFIGRGEAVQAIKALDQFDYVGVMEDIPSFCAFISQLTGEVVSPARLSVRNPARLAETVNFEDPAILDYYRHAVRWDAFLYTAARDQLRVHAMSA
jgi:hypothetical protein